MSAKNLFLKNYYNSLYKGSDYGYVIQPDIWIQKYISYVSSGYVLELGVGTGKNIDFLLEKDFFVEGVDLSDIIIEKLNSKYDKKNCKFWVEDITQINIAQNKYSLIICSMVLSHLSENEIIALIEKIKDGLVSGGCIYISTMSKDDPMNFNSLNNCSHTISKNNNKQDYLERTFLDKKQVKKYFENFEIIELADIYQKEPLRTTALGYFGLIMYLGKKC